jgi:V/A-type H+-transporting ATPase subunit E
MARVWIRQHGSRIVSEELQALLERINRDGVEKAEAERDRIVAEAQKTAEKTVADAKVQADKIVSDAKHEADLLRQKGEEALKQAARDTVLSLDERLKARMSAVVKAAVAEDADTKGFAEALTKWVEAELESDDAVSIEVGVSKDDAETLRKHLMAKLGDDFKARVEVAPVKRLDAGFVLKFSGSDLVYDFSGDALTEVLCEFLSPRLVEIIAEPDA